ncbi:MAG: hypothetical protein ONB44_01800 [candidate division KSB1 bacterium]|nr:hypothetical protein [candidate division KSB1 bacterium]
MDIALMAAGQASVGHGSEATDMLERAAKATVQGATEKWRRQD